MASHGSKLTFEKTDLDHFPARVFLDFPRRIGFRVSGTKKNSRMSNNEYRMSNNEYRDSSMNIEIHQWISDVQQWISRCPTMNIEIQQWIHWWISSSLKSSSLKSSFLAYWTPIGPLYGYIKKLNYRRASWYCGLVWQSLQAQPQPLLPNGPRPASIKAGTSPASSQRQPLIELTCE